MIIYSGELDKLVIKRNKRYEMVSHNREIAKKPTSNQNKIKIFVLSGIITEKTSSNE